MPNQIQLREHSERRFEGRWRRRRFAHFEVDGNPRFLNANRNDDGRWLDTNWANPDDNWNDNGAFAWSFSQLSSFLSCFGGRVLFYELTVPAAEHLPGVFQRRGDRYVFLRIKGFDLPCDEKEEFKRIEGNDRLFDERLFLLSLEEARDEDALDRLKKVFVYGLAESVSGSLWERYNIFVPKLVRQFNLFEDGQELRLLEKSVGGGVASKVRVGSNFAMPMMISSPSKICCARGASS